MGDGSSTDSSWYENDGVVNTVSMYGPTTGENGGDPTIKYDKNDILIPGQWYWKKINDIDHWNITGHMCDNKKEKISIDFFREQFKILKALPPL